ncbi:uracil-DNA glycosylase family protein [Erythrobacter gaetbuli]|uniref:Uracil-DNA glycosylase family protein n=1 Tax=Qipengyuania gaetbuli TaxID=266952 RepID=A0A844XYS3_9SPHN|nr:uracil-DNA glycosylase family protein [Qipengyuania gaetbuli]
MPHGVRPVASFSPTARLLIIGQAPGSKVHASGIPWDDASGDRLREWTGLTRKQMYDPAQVALVPMGFCYPGKASGGDNPPRPECAPQWHDRVLEVLPDARLTLLVGTYAQARYLPETRKLSLAERVRNYRDYLPEYLPLPHPSWRSTMFMRANPWFEAELVPALREAVAQRIR